MPADGPADGEGLDDQPIPASVLQQAEVAHQLLLLVQHQQGTPLGVGQQIVPAAAAKGDFGGKTVAFKINDGAQIIGSGRAHGQHGESLFGYLSSAPKM